MSFYSTLRNMTTWGALATLVLPACEMSTEEWSEEEWAEADPLGDIELDQENDQSVASARASVPMSKGYYAIPYEPGVEVKVTNDHLTHPHAPNRIDLKGKSGGPYKIVAAAAGTVRRIDDSHNVNGGCSNNNYVWIEHANGEWTKYSHISQWSATSDAGLSEGDKVKVGQFLGIEDNIGCADGDHLHFEVAIPNDPSDPIDPDGGYIKGVNRIPRVCGIPNNLYVDGDKHIVPGVRPGWGEYTRFGLADDKFQEVFSAASKCGYRMTWNDGFERNGKPYYNAVFHPNKEKLGWKSHRRLTAAQLDAKKVQYNDQDYELVHLDTYNVGTAVRYAAIWNKGASVPQTISYHGYTAAQHQAIFNAWKAAGWRPRVVSPTSVGGVLTYAGVYTLGSIGSYRVKSAQTSAQYQANYTANKNAGRRLIYLNSYVHNGAPRYTAIWASSAAPLVFAKHGQTAGQLQAHWSSKIGAGWLTGAITGLQVGGLTRYAGYWEK